MPRLSIISPSDMRLNPHGSAGHSPAVARTRPNVLAKLAMVAAAGGTSQATAATTLRRADGHNDAGQAHGDADQHTSGWPGEGKMSVEMTSVPMGVSELSSPARDAETWFSP